MFACIYGRSVSEITAGWSDPNALVDLAFAFSPLVEQTAGHTVVFDVSGQNLLFGAPKVSSASGVADDETDLAHHLAKEIARQATRFNLQVNVAIAANPDAAIHAARAFKGATVIAAGEEASRLGPLAISKLDHSLAEIEAKRAAEIHETFSFWGVRTFADLAGLPLAGIAERLGQEGLRLKKLARGAGDRPLKLVRPPIGFQQSLELEHSISELEPLSFILSRLLNQLCANLCEYALATNEVRLRLVTDARANGAEDEVTEIDHRVHERTITLPVPMRDPKTLLRLLLFDIEAQPPNAPIIAVSITADPVKPHARQKGLFIPLAPEPEKLEITLARLAKLVGADRVGSPELIDTHRPDSFRMVKFRLHRRNGRNVRSDVVNAGTPPKLPIIGFRIFRPAWRADVQTKGGQPKRINARGNQASANIRGQIICAAGPWRSSGDWWRADVWARDEWDIAVADSSGEQGEVLCRIYRDLTSDEWFLTGIYD